MIQLISSHLLSSTSWGRSAWLRRRYFQTNQTIAAATITVSTIEAYMMK